MHELYISESMYYNKYLKYKNKYLKIKLNNIGGGNVTTQKYVRDKNTGDVLKYTYIPLVTIGDDLEPKFYNDNIKIAEKYATDQSTLHDYAISTSIDKRVFESLQTAIDFYSFIAYNRVNNEKIYIFGKYVSDMKFVLAECRKNAHDLHYVSINRNCNDTIMGLLCTYDIQQNTLFILCIVPSLIYAVQIYHSTINKYVNLQLRIFVFTSIWFDKIYANMQKIYVFVHMLEQTDTILSERSFDSLSKFNTCDIEDRGAIDAQYIRNINNTEYIMYVVHSTKNETDSPDDADMPVDADDILRTGTG